MKKSPATENTNELYEKLMRGFVPSPFISSDWQMQGGLYHQYSAYENNDSCPSGTSSTIRLIAL